MNRIENIKTEIEKLKTSLREVEARLCDAKRDVDQNQQQYETARSVATKASARTHLDDALREFDHHSRHKEQLEQSKKDKTHKLRELQLQEKEKANDPLRKQAEELAQQLNKKQDEIVSILRQMENLQSQFQSTDKYDYLINWQNSNAQLIIDNLPYFFWVNNSRKTAHYRIVKLSDKVIRN
jgi:DNA repair exonuclease SbcCD ATPase subunit